MLEATITILMDDTGDGEGNIPDAPHRVVSDGFGGAYVAGWLVGTLTMFP